MNDNSPRSGARGLFRVRPREPSARELDSGREVTDRPGEMEARSPGGEEADRAGGRLGDFKAFVSTGTSALCESRRVVLLEGIWNAIPLSGAQ